MLGNALAGARIFAWISQLVKRDFKAGVNGSAVLL